MLNLIGNFKKEKLSKFNVVIENKDGFVFYNQISGSLILFAQEEFDQYRRLLKGDFFVDLNFLETLRKNKFLISESFDEVEYMQKKYDANKHKSYDKQLTIVPTDKCNLGCYYCYEDKSQWKNMSDETIQQTKKFVEVFLKSSPTNSLFVNWFGGEPTLNLSCIEELNKFFVSICIKNKIQYDQLMVTNATNINEKVVERLSRMGIKKYQVTIDGYKEDHDKNRPYLSDLSIEEMNDAQIEQRRKTNPNFGKFLNIIDQPTIKRKKKSTYDEIIKNLQIMHQNGFEISLRCNISSSNIKRYDKLLNHLEELGLTKKNEKKGIVKPYVAQISNHTSNKNLRDLTREEFSDFEKKCPTSSTILNSFDGQSCTANKQFSFCVSQSGNLSKCWHHVSNEEYVIGDIYDLNLAKDGFVDNFSPFDDPECLTCHVLPTCLGGCKAQNGFYEKKYDEKKYHGCDTTRWNIRSKVNSLYKKVKLANKSS